VVGREGATGEGAVDGRDCAGELLPVEFPLALLLEGRPRGPNEDCSPISLIRGGAYLALRPNVDHSTPGEPPESWAMRCNRCLALLEEDPESGEGDTVRDGGSSISGTASSKTRGAGRGLRRI
jgi:hypothetical protein